MRPMGILDMSLGVLFALVTGTGTGQAQVAAGTSKSAAIDAWQIEMAYVKANKPHRVNGFLVGSGEGQLGTLRMQKDISKIESDAFVCTLIEPISANDDISAFVNGNQAWSMSDIQVGQFAYPMVGMVKTSTGKTFSIFPANCQAKIDIKPGHPAAIKGYTISARHPIGTGEQFPVLVVTDNIISIEETDGKPSFTALSTGR